MNPKVSVIVPVYNVEKYLDTCLKSIIKQTLKDIEIICVDDGSTDNSSTILDRYAKRDNRIKVIHKKNSGYGHTMNVGLDVSKGEYIGIVESDDYISDQMYETLYDAAKNNSLDVVKSDHYTFSGDDLQIKKQYHYICPLDYYNRIINVQNQPTIYSFEMMNWTGIYKSDFLKNNKIRHNETPGASFQDNGFWFQTITLANKIMFLNKAFYYYRQDNPNSSINSKEKVFCICDEYAYISEFLKNHKELGEEVYRCFFEKKVFNYLNSYNRISDEYKMTFLERISKEFEEDLKKSEINVSKLDSWVLCQVNRIIDSPKLFYIEDGLYRYDNKYKKTHEKLMSIRNSKEFNLGIRIKKRLGLI